MSTAYDAIEASLQRKPVYKARFAFGSPLVFSTHPVRVNVQELEETLTVDEFFEIDEAKAYVDEFHAFPFVDHSPLGDMFPFIDLWLLATSFAYMLLPAMTAPMQILPQRAQCSVGSVQIVLTDVNGEATALMTDDLFGTEVEILCGFNELDEEDYITAYIGTIQTVRLTSDLSGYELTLDNAQTKVNRQLFASAKTTLNFDISADAEVLSVPLGAAQYFQESGYLLIDEEILYYGDREAATFIFLDRGAFGRTPVAHAAGAQVQEIFVLGPAHPIDIMLGIYYGTSSKTCLDLGYHDIDWTAFAAAREAIGVDYQMQFFILNAENALDFLARQLYLPIGAYPYVTQDGKISIRVFETPGTPDMTFDHASIVARSGRPDIGWNMADRNLSQPINDATVNYNFDPTTGKYHSTYIAARQPSIDAHGRFPIVINSAGLRAELTGTSAFVADRVDAILNRYENPGSIIRVRTHLQKRGAEVGNIAALTSAAIPNRQTGTRGVSAARVEIINRSIQWDDGFVEFTLRGADVQL